jgi:hypothetical protein
LDGGVVPVGERSTVNENGSVDVMAQEGAAEVVDVPLEQAGASGQTEDALDDNDGDGDGDNEGDGDGAEEGDSGARGAAPKSGIRRLEEEGEVAADYLEERSAGAGPEAPGRWTR